MKESLPKHTFAVYPGHYYYSREGPKGLSFRVINDAGRALFVKVWDLEEEVQKQEKRNGRRLAFPGR